MTPYDQYEQYLSIIRQTMVELSYIDSRLSTLTKELYSIKKRFNDQRITLSEALRSLQDHIFALATRNKANDLGLQIDWDNSILGVEAIQEQELQEPTVDIVDTTPEAQGPDDPSNKP